MSTSGWVGVDLDGTLAEYGTWKPIVSNNKARALGLIGAPIPAMMERVKGWLARGIEVRIFTARVSDGDPETIIQIQDWCEQHIGQRLKVTNVKDFSCWAIVDDRAVAVEKNTGRILASYLEHPEHARRAHQDPGQHPQGRALQPRGGPRPPRGGRRPDAGRPQRAGGGSRADAAGPRRHRLGLRSARGGIARPPSTILAPGPRARGEAEARGGEARTSDAPLRTAATTASVRRNPFLYDRCECGWWKAISASRCQNCYLDSVRRAGKAPATPRLCSQSGCPEVAESTQNRYGVRRFRLLCAAHRKRKQRGTSLKPVVVRRR